MLINKKEIRCLLILNDSHDEIFCFRHHKPLGRTHSAPLPIGHPFLQQQNLLLQQQQDLSSAQSHDQALKDKLFVKQHIRQAVLQRVGSKSHMENVDEETEAKLAQVCNKVFHWLAQTYNRVFQLFKDKTKKA